MTKHTSPSHVTEHKPKEEAATKHPVDQALLKKLDDSEKAHQEVKGKANYNPFFILTMINKLRSEVKRGSITPEITEFINDLPLTPKPIDPNYVEPAPQQTATIRENVNPTNAPGLKFPTK